MITQAKASGERTGSRWPLAKRDGNVGLRAASLGSRGGAEHLCREPQPSLWEAQASEPVSTEEKVEGEGIQMEEEHEEGRLRQVEHRTSQEARRTSVERKWVHGGRLGMGERPQGRGEGHVLGWFSASSSDASL